MRTSIGLAVFLAVVMASPVAGAEPEKGFSGWSFYLDNDFLAAGDRDFDYTGGFAFSRSGSAVKTAFLSVDSWLESVGGLLGVADLYRRQGYLVTHTQEFGATFFTPEDLESKEPVDDQHPYGSLFFISNSRMAIDPVERITYQSILTLGVIGLPLAGDIQAGIHEVMGADEPRGWDNQISAGGEPTFRYSILRSKNHSLPAGVAQKLEIKSSLEANLGFTTDVGAALSLRAGRLKSPWWAFNVHSAEYINLGSPTPRTRGSDAGESYFWTGLSLKYRIYNAFLQGQIRSSEVTYDRDELEQIVAEAWIGYTHGFASGLEISGFIRARSAEIDLDNIGAPVWGGLIIGRSF